MNPRVIGRYTVKRELGYGSTASVLLCETAGGAPVAVKLLHPPLAAVEVVRERFLDAGRRMLELDHPNIVRIHDLLDDDQYCGIIQEYCVRRSVPEGSIYEGSRVESLLPIAHAITDALTAAHAAGIVHAGLKPSNLLSADKLVKITDFGMAAVHDSGGLTSSTMMAAMSPYQAPEVFAGLPPEPALDLYSLGALLYRWITGESHRTAESIRAHAEENRDAGIGLQRIAEKLTEHLPERYAYLTTIVQSLLGPRESRPGSAKLLAEALSSGRILEPESYRVCLYCLSPIPAETPFCLECGRPEKMIAPYFGEDAESLVLGKLAEKDRMLHTFISVLKTIAGDPGMKLRLLLENKNYYSKKEKQEGTPLPVRIIDNLQPADASLLITALEKPGKHDIRIIRMPYLRAVKWRKRGPLITARPVLPEYIPSVSEIERLREAYRTARNPQAKRTVLTAARIPDVTDSRLQTVRALREAREYLDSVHPGRLYVDLRSLKRKIETESDPRRIQEYIEAELRIKAVIERYYRTERRYAALLSDAAEL